MGGIGIVNNPRSRRNRRRPEIARRLREIVDGEGEVVDASTPDELARAVERLRAAGVDVLGVNGGDGTGHYVLTAFAHAYGGAPLPRFLPLRGGSMNTVAHGHGIRGSPEGILKEVLYRLHAGRPLRTVARDLLRVEVDGEPVRHGFIFGTGAVVRFLEAYYRAGDPSPLTAAKLVLVGAGSALVGGEFARALTTRERLRVTTDGDEWPDLTYLAFLAGTSPDVGLGFRALARCDEQPGFFHAVGVTGSIARVALSIPRLRAGRPYRRRLALDAVSRALVLEGERIRYTIDGDLYGTEGRVRVSTGPALDVVLP
jgi:diacylglycerol kinase family enzyme